MTENIPTRRRLRSDGARRRLSTNIFLLSAGVALVLFFGWLGIGAPGDREMVVLALTVVVAGVGVWFVAPEFYEVNWMRMLVIEFFAAGTLVVLSYRLVFDLLSVHAGPHRSYPFLTWLLAALILQVITAGAAVAVLSRTTVVRIRRIMVVFGVTGLAVAITAASTYALDLGYTVERWGLVTVWAAFGFYPVLAVPTYALLSGIVGWGWALTLRTHKVAHAAGPLLFAAVLVAVFNYSVVRDPFRGLAVLAIVLGVWGYLFAKYPEFDPMVTTVPQRILDQGNET